MIVEERIYTLHVGKVPVFMKIYENEALPILRRHLGTQYGFFINDIGTQNMIVHLWPYESYEDREIRRANLVADPGWTIVRQKNHPLILHQENRIMKPAPFFEPLLKAMLNAGKP